MRRIDPEVWQATYGSLICLAVGLPVAIAGVRGDGVTAVPAWLWWAGFAGFVAAQTTCTWLMDATPARLLRRVLAAQVALGCLLALGAPAAGWTSILLIYTAALSVYLVPPRATAAIVAVQTLAVTGAALLGEGGPGAVALVTALNLLLQLASVAGIRATRSVEETNRRLSVAHTELAAAGALLAESSRSEERLRIARELHDLLGHQLTVLTLELETARHKADPAEHVERANAVARELLADVRGTVGELRRTAPDLRATLERIVAGLPAPAVHLDIAPDVRADETRTTTIVRCVQEVVTNAIRHAGATDVWVTIRASPEGGLVLEARDNGSGAGRVEPGHGLTGIAERIGALGGRARFDGGAPGRPGFRVTAEVPAP